MNQEELALAFLACTHTGNYEAICFDCFRPLKGKLWDAKIPGLVAKHMVVSDACRSRGEDVAMQDALGQLTDQYLQTQAGYPSGKGTKFHLALTIELAPRTKERGSDE